MEKPDKKPVLIYRKPLSKTTPEIPINSGQKPDEKNPDEVSVKTRQKPKGKKSIVESVGSDQKQKGRIENLKSWKPGQSGNPKGRPVKDPITHYLKELASVEITNQSTGQKMERAQALAETAFAKALKGDFRFWNAIMERLEGKVVQKTDITTGGQPLHSDVDLTKLSDAALEELENALQKSE